MPGWSEGLAGSRAGLSQMLGNLTDLARAIAAKKQAKAQTAQGWVNTILGGLGQGADIYGGFKQRELEKQRLTQEQTNEQARLGLAQEQLGLSKEQLAWSKGEPEREAQREHENRGFQLRLTTAGEMADTRKLAAQLRNAREVAGIQAASREGRGAGESPLGAAYLYLDNFVNNIWLKNHPEFATRAGTADVQKIDRVTAENIFKSALIDAPSQKVSPDVLRNAWTLYFGIQEEQANAGAGGEIARPKGYKYTPTPQVKFGQFIQGIGQQGPEAINVEQMGPPSLTPVIEAIKSASRGENLLPQETGEPWIPPSGPTITDVLELFKKKKKKKK